MRHENLLTAIVCGATLLLAASTGGAQPPPLTPQPVNLPSQPPTSPGSFPVNASTVDGWVSANDQTSIRTHGWALWSGITSITSQSQGWPVFETWYTDSEVE